MTDTEKAEEPAGPHPYFLAIEDVFIDLRGSPLQLSPKDWQIARGWYEEGIPLELVERTVRELFERRRAAGKEDKVWSLGHCKRSVDAAWKRRQKLLAPGAAEDDDEQLDLAARLENLASALPAGLEERQAMAGRIRGLDGDAEEIEKALAEIDREIVRRARGGPCFCQGGLQQLQPRTACRTGIGLCVKTPVARVLVLFHAP